LNLPAEAQVLLDSAAAARDFLAGRW